MILSWTTSKTVVSRIMRNIKGVEAEYMDDIPEWIAEGIRKMKTKYSLEVAYKDVQLQFHIAKLHCPGEAIITVDYCGHELDYKPMEGHAHRHDWWEDTFIKDMFRSGVPLTDTAGNIISDLDSYEGKNPFPRDIIQKEQRPNHNAWYTINYNKIQSSLCDEIVRVWYMRLPVDEDNFPMIPDVEEYEEALYRYCRMMLIEAGFEDKVFNHGMAQGEWEKASNRAIGAITYPTERQVHDTVMRHLNIFPHDYNWGAIL